MKRYSVKQLAKLAGVTVRTLHLYDEKGLLKPSVRTEAKYRFYDEKELLKLQQILFYKELGFSLLDIHNIINDTNFDIVRALESHKIALKERHNRISTLLTTIDKTIYHLKNGGNMLKDEDLYEGLPKDKAKAYRLEAIEKWGQDTVEKRFLNIGKQLFELQNEEPTASVIQDLIAQHYACIEVFWGKKPTAEAYIGLGQLYTQDARYSMQNGAPQHDYAAFLSKAILYFVDTKLY
jgi:DNA-binding transcriptional MerR regulator